jgi:1,4-dihydroxy-2-naphthoate octaprenyltransferase
MFSQSTWLHLRIPFSYFLMPVFLFALGISPNLIESQVLWAFVILHGLVYPASNGYNSYFDKDEESIGGLRRPPPVKKGLYYLSLVFDVLALFLSYWMVSPLFSMMVFLYGLASKAYSHPQIRLKKYPITGWLIIGFFQGLFTLMMCYAGINHFQMDTILKARVLIPGVLTSIMLLGSYPITQIYQHKEDALRGDKTISLLLGIRGTFFFVAGVFTVTTILFVIYFLAYYTMTIALAFVVSLSPVLLFFGIWFYRSWHDVSKANFSNTMVMNFISATSLNAFFVYFFLATRNIF